jgi:hypothetical protein
MARRTRLWLLKARDEVLGRPTHPWVPPYDKVRRVVVRASSEERARQLAQGVAGNEGRGVYRGLGATEDEVAADVWLDPLYTECNELGARGEPGVIVVDRWEG